MHNRLLLELDFETPFDAGETSCPATGSWSAWFGQLEREPDYAVLWSGPPVHGYEPAPVRVGGYFVEPVESVLGLRPFDDAHEGRVELEGVDGPVPYVFFEFEKIARMMLHDSGLAFEILASPARLRSSEPGEAREIVEWTATRGLLGHYRECTRGGLDDLRAGREVSIEGIRRLFRELATGAALTEGRAMFDLGRLLEQVAGEAVAEVIEEGGAEAIASRRGELVETAERLADAIAGEATALPAQPDGYEALDARIVERRLSGA